MSVRVRSLTQSEAEERAALISVERYDIDVDLTALPTGPEVRCRSTITFTCTQPGATTFVDCAAEVTRAELDGSPLPPAADGRVPLPALTGRHVVVVECVQANTADGEGVHKAVDPADGEVYLWMCAAPDEGRFVWASFDQPDLKAPHRFVVSAPAPWTVLSNSPVAGIEETVVESGPARVWTFQDTPPLSTYNPVVLAGPFHEVRREVDGHDLGLYCRRSLRDVLERDAEEIFTVTSQGLGFYAEKFQMPFPQRKYDQVFLPDFGGAMENYGCVAWSDSFLSRSDPTPAETELLARVLLHELAHMWFGNIVTMRWWDDLWLNEAFAEFAANWAALRATRHTDSWATHLAHEQLNAYAADQGPMTHPIHQPIPDVQAAAAIFDAITYPKGATVLWQLMVYVGEDRFSAGMADYFAQHAWGSTTLRDLVDALAAASGRDLEAWREGWLATAGTDRLALEQGDGGLVLRATGPEGAPPRPHVTRVGAYRATELGLERFASASVEVSGPRTPVALPAGADLYLVNDENDTFATSRPDAASRPIVFQRAGLLPTTLSRAVAVAMAWDMLMHAEADAGEVVGCLAGVLEHETALSVLEPHLNRACDAAELWCSERRRPALTAQVAATCRSLAGLPDRAQVALRGLARTGDVEDLEWMREQRPEDVELRWRVQARLSELGVADPRETEALLATDPDPDAWVQALIVQASSPYAADKEEAWEKLVVQRKVPIGVAKLVCAALWRPGQDDVLRPYAERYLDLLPSLDQGGMLPAMVFSQRLFPLFAVDESYFERAREAAREAAPVVRKGMLERSDLTRRMLAARAAG